MKLEAMEFAHGRDGKRIRVIARDVVALQGDGAQVRL